MCNEPDFRNECIELIAEITAAFDSVSREDGTTLHEAAAIDDRNSERERQAARKLDVEQRWQDVPDDDIFACCSTIPLMDDKGFRYYIPAFMVYALRHWQDDPKYIRDSCEFNLLHESQKSLRKSDPSSIVAKYGFTDAQCRAITRFLQFVTKPYSTPVTSSAVENGKSIVPAQNLKPPNIFSGLFLHLKLKSIFN